MIKSAILVLEDKHKFYGNSIGVKGMAVGEVVFNSSMTGYQEILTDPSYSHHIITLTYPHIGNVGTNLLDEESFSIYAKGLIIRDLSLISSNYRSKKNLSEYLKEHNVVAISDIDTRKITRLLREKGSQNGCIIAGDNQLNAKKALEKAKYFTGIKGIDIVKKISTKESYNWYKGSGRLKKKTEKFYYHVVAYDYGVKQKIIRSLVDRGCRITVVPAQTNANKIFQMNTDGILLSNGPGDPEPCNYAITAIKNILNTNIPIFGICLGHQLLALASGAHTVKMKLGHHGANHPVKDIEKNKVMITSQNHGFSLEKKNIPDTLKITHKSLFDNTIQGIRHTDKRYFSFQGHPEASPGPHDATFIFNNFIKIIDTYCSEKKSGEKNAKT